MNKKYTSLMYHEIVSPTITKYSVSPNMYEAHMRALKKAGVDSFILDSSSDDLSGSKCCLLTFDDGHISNLYAARVMAEMGLVGYFYLLKDNSLELDDYLKEDNIKELAKLGHKFGVHGKNHGWWTKKTPERLVSELRETKDWIEQLTGQNVITCSAPGGIIDKRTIDAIRNGFPDLKYIRTSQYGVNDGNDTLLKSIGVMGKYSADTIVGIAKQDMWTMSRVMTYYYVKETIKPVYHWLKRK